MKILLAASQNHHEATNTAAAAGSFPWPEGSEIRVLTVGEVISTASLGLVPPVLDMPEIQAKIDDAAIDTATAVAAELRRRGYRAAGVTKEGDPTTAIADYARQWGADLIVVGSDDRSHLERLMEPSVSEGVVKQASCSVPVVKQNNME